MARLVAMFVAVLVVFGASSIAQEPPASGDLTGIYRCEGKNPDGSPYRGVVQIAAVGGTYLVRWTLSGTQEVTGVGILRHDTLSVSYFGGTPAIVVYNKDGDRLIGEWTMGGTEGVVFTETLTRMRRERGQPDDRLEPEPAPRRQPERPSGLRL